MAADDDKRATLAKAMENRRVELRMSSWDEVARGAGISVAHLRRIRNNTAALTPMVTRGIENALQWAHGTIGRFLGDEEPGVAAHNMSPTLSAAAPLTAVAEVADVPPDDLPDDVVWGELDELERYLWLAPGASVPMRTAWLNMLHAIRRIASGDPGPGHVEGRRRSS